MILMKRCFRTIIKISSILLINQKLTTYIDDLLFLRFRFLDLVFCRNSEVPASTAALAIFLDRRDAHNRKCWNRTIHSETFRTLTIRLQEMISNEK